MKKLLFVLALGAFAACNNGDDAANASDSADTTTVVTPDTTTVVTPDSTTLSADTTAAADTTKK